MIRKTLSDIISCVKEDNNLSYKKLSSDTGIPVSQLQKIILQGGCGVSIEVMEGILSCYGFKLILDIDQE